MNPGISQKKKLQQRQRIPNYLIFYDWQIPEKIRFGHSSVLCCASSHLSGKFQFQSHKSASEFCALLSFLYPDFREPEKNYLKPHLDFPFPIFLFLSVHSTRLILFDFTSQEILVYTFLPVHRDNDQLFSVADIRLSGHIPFQN